MRWMISVEWVSRTAREGSEGLEDMMVVGWGDFGDKRICMGESLLKM